jgi:hypothetical protein
MPSRKPYRNSPYDDGGMPLGTETADYDNADEVRMAQVKDLYVPEPTIFDMDYQPKQFTKKETGMDRNHGLPYGNKGFNSAVGEEPGLPLAEDLNVVDVEDPGEKRKLYVKEAEEKGWSETPELPKVEKQETVDEIKDDIEEDNKEESEPEQSDEDFENELAHLEDGENKE